MPFRSLIGYNPCWDHHDELPYPLQYLDFLLEQLEDSMDLLKHLEIVSPKMAVGLPCKMQHIEGGKKEKKMEDFFFFYAFCFLPLVRD